MYLSVFNKELSIGLCCVGDLYENKLNKILKYVYL